MKLWNIMVKADERWASGFFDSQTRAQEVCDKWNEEMGTEYYVVAEQ